MFDDKKDFLTLVFCTSASAEVSRGVVANGSRFHDIGCSCRLVAVLSPIALFFPMANLLHLLE